MNVKKFSSKDAVTTVNSNQSFLMTDENGNVDRIKLEALKA